MNRMPSVVASQPSMHMQPVHSGPMISGSLSIASPMASGVPHSVHAMQMPGPHEREPRDHILSGSGSGPVPGHYFPAMGVNPGSPHQIANMIPHGPPHQFYHPHPVLALNRLPHFIGQPELRIFEMNKRLQQRSEDCDSLWWESFTTDFFEDDATLTLGFLTEEGPKRYTIGRAVIPRYFRSIFESGCGELYYNLRLNHEYFHHPSLTLDSESATMTMNMVRSVPTTVVVEGRLTLEFAFDEFMRIRSWIFLIRSHREMIMRSMLGIQDPAFLEQLSKNITRYGVPSNTLNFFRLCVILEPMQELMSRQKAYSLTPRDCLKTTLFQKWQRMMPQEATRQPSKRRKRKGSAAASDSSNNSGTGGRASKRKQSPLPIPPHQMAQPGRIVPAAFVNLATLPVSVSDMGLWEDDTHQSLKDVMIVGEPTLMGGDFGDEDERLITRLENTQYDAAAAAAAAGGGVSTIPSSSHIHPNFPCPNESPAGLISSSSLGNMPMNSVSHSGVSFRGPLSSGGGSSTNPMGMNEPVFANSFSSMTPQHLSNLSGSMIPNQVGGISASMPGRLMPQNTSAAMSQQYGPMPGKISLSGSNTPSSRDLYQGPFSAGTMDVVHQPARANSASSLLDGNNGSGVGFSSCPSPSLINSRPAPARFTPPSMPNGLGNSVTSSSTPSSSSQPSFAIPADMMSCSVNSNNPQQQQSQQPQQQQQQQTPMSGPVLSSPMPSSYTPDAMDTTAGGILHSSTPVASQPVVSSVSKSSNSPLMFACMGNNAGGNQLLPEGPLPSMMTSSSAGDPTSGMSMNENEDLKPPPPCLAHQSRSASESGEA